MIVFRESGIYNHVLMRVPHEVSDPFNSNWLLHLFFILEQLHVWQGVNTETCFFFLFLTFNFSFNLKLFGNIVTIETPLKGLQRFSFKLLKRPNLLRKLEIPHYVGLFSWGSVGEDISFTGRHYDTFYLWLWDGNDSLHVSSAKKVDFIVFDHNKVSSLGAPRHKSVTDNLCVADILIFNSTVLFFLALNAVPLQVDFLTQLVAILLSLGI